MIGSIDKIDEKKKKINKKGRRKKGIAPFAKYLSSSTFQQNRLHYARAIFRNRKIEKSGIDQLLATRPHQGSRFHEGKNDR